MEESESMKFNKRNRFNLSHEVKLSCDMGKLIPFYLEEILPGDRFSVRTNAVLRLAPLLAPIMHQVDLYTHFFFVPNRLVFDDWEPFITGGPEGTDSTEAPYIVTPHSGGFLDGSLADYLGVPTNIADLKVSAIPFRVYDLVYNEWYRDQNLQEPLSISKGNGLDEDTEVDIQNRCWKTDYFTGSLPFMQRGQPVHLPLGQTAPVVFGQGAGKDYTPYLETQIAPGKQVGVCNSNYGSNSRATYTGVEDGEGNRLIPVGTAYGGPLVTDLSEATAATINDIRQAFQIQRWMEANAYAGSRYVESILQHFGIRSSDARLQRSEFLGGGRSPIIISEVLQTSQGTEESPQGTMAGHGISVQRSHQFKKFFEEHGYIIGILSIMPKATYQQGLHRTWFRKSRYDYYWPVFSHLGQQAVLNKEIYATGNDASDEGIFGYQDRYEEYRRHYGSVHGEFRDRLNFWHMGRIFANQPELNSDFVTCKPTKRIHSVTTDEDDTCWLDIYNVVHAIRPIPRHGTPGLIDHA